MSAWPIKELDEKDAEIERLKAEFQKAKEWNQLCEMQIRNLQEICKSQENLITELANLSEPYSGPQGPDNLIDLALGLAIQRAREATR